MNTVNTVRTGTPMTRGVLFVHSAPSALCAHIEWAAAGVLGGKVDLAWTPQPAEIGPVLFTNTSPTYANLTVIEE